MKRLFLRCGLLGLLSVLVGSMGLAGPGAAHATGGTTIGPLDPIIFLTEGSWQDSNVTLAAAVSSSPSDNQILIPDQGRSENQSYLNGYVRVGWTVMVDSEPMCITDIINGGDDYPYPPETMVVQRAQACGGVAGVPVAHASGAVVQAHSLTFDVYAQNVTVAHGLGGFEISLTFPAGTQYVKAVYNDQWLTSTGRESWCDGPALIEGSYQMACATMGPSNNPTLSGPTGTGLIGRVTVLPPESPATPTISLAGSYLTNIYGGGRDSDGDLHAAVQNYQLSVVRCPDVNLDGRINGNDMYIIARSNGAEGRLAGTLVGAITSSATSATISDQSLLSVNNTISIDGELMTVQQLTEGSPDTMTMSRANQVTLAKPHAAGAEIWRGSTIAPLTGTYAYTRLRDPNQSRKIDGNDLYIAARAMMARQSQNYYCPVH